MIKIFVVGPCGVGKTSMCISYSTNAFPGDPCCTPTIFDNAIVDVGFENRTVKIDLWDICRPEVDSGDDRYALQFHDTNVFLLCVSLVAPDSLRTAREVFVPTLKGHGEGIPIVVVGTKLDLVKTAVDVDDDETENVSRAQLESFGREINAAAVVMNSGKTQRGLSHTFRVALRLALNGVEVRPRGGLFRCCCPIGDGGGLFVEDPEESRVNED